MDLPSGPLSMSGLLNLEPPALRRLLKQGLRLGLDQAGLEQLLRADWGFSADSLEAKALLATLAERGWFLWNPDSQRWKTHLG